MNTKKLISIVLAILIVVSIIATAFADGIMPTVNSFEVANPANITTPDGDKYNQNISGTEALELFKKAAKLIGYMLRLS